MMNIVVLDGHAANPGDLSWEPLKAFGALKVYERTAPDQVIVRAKDADIVLMNKIDMTDEVIRQLPKLKYIGILATGYNNIDTESAHRHGVIVCNIPSYSTESVVQATFAHILNITNQVAHYADQNRAADKEGEGLRWSRNPDFCYWDTPLPELSGKTLGIVGLGHIGQRVAQVALAFGMRVFAYTSKDQSQLPEGVYKATPDGLLHSSDIVSLHCPLTKDNFHFINADSISKMRQGTILINTARGALVDEQAIADALAGGQLGGYGADVMAEEPPRPDNPLFRQPHAYITPHVAWATLEARRRLMDICMANIKAFLQGEPINKV